MGAACNRTFCKNAVSQISRCLNHYKSLINFSKNQISQLIAVLSHGYKHVKLENRKKKYYTPFYSTRISPYITFLHFSLAPDKKMGPRRTKSYRDDPPLNCPKIAKKKFKVKKKFFSI